jgi:uncharacterized protein DUF5996
MLKHGSAAVSARDWPELPYAAWRDTMETLHMELQIIGKVRLALSPFEPQWANVPLYLTARGLTTTPMASGDQVFQVDVDLIDHQVVLINTLGDLRRVPLTARPVAEFYRDFTEALRSLGIEVEISPRPSEVTKPIAFAEDVVHAAYDPTWATRFFRALSQIDLAFKEHRSIFRGKTSQVNFFWGTFDLALMRYSGRAVAPPANAGVIERRAGDAELICVGFWPGNAKMPAPNFFGYASPAPAGIEHERVRPAGAHWDPTIREFLLPYDEVRTAASPRQAILEFCDSVYTAGARLGGWPSDLLVDQPS